MINISKISDEVSGFLSAYKMNYRDIDASFYVELFLKHMHAGLAGKDSSLKMLPTFIDCTAKISGNKPVIALDAGGTNLRSAIVNFKKGMEVSINYLNKSRMPGVEKKVSREDFFNAIADNIEGLLNKSDRIGFVFSYPIEIFADRDGKLIRFTKEIKAPEVVGEFIGKNLLKALKRKSYSADKKIVLLNDTVAILLSGIIAFADRQYDSFIGFVLGTGMNACYIEKNSNIKKQPSKDPDTKGCQVINIEAGSFLYPPSGKIDASFDAKTLNPGAALFEKMLSGAYLGGLVLEVFKFAANEGLFSVAIKDIFKSLKSLQSREVDEYLNYPPHYTEIGKHIDKMTEKDKITVYFLLDSMVERAAVLSAIVLASSIIKSGKGNNPCHPVCIVAEGSSFYKMKNFKSRVDKYLQEILSQKGNYYFEIQKVENAAMLGGATAGLTI